MGMGIGNGMKSSESFEPLHTEHDLLVGEKIHLLMELNLRLANMKEISKQLFTQN